MSDTARTPQVQCPIPGALVEKAARAANALRRHSELAGWEYCSPEMMRAALEAAAPSLIAQGMTEAKKVAVERLLAYDELAAQLAMTTILARAAEIEGGKG